MILVLGGALPSPGSGQDNDSDIEWQSEHLPEHPLTGKIWDTANARFITSATLYRQLRDADFVLLGEVHANPDHHFLQGRVIERLVARGRQPAVVFEMFERDQQALIERTLARVSPSDAADRLGRATRMDARGWSWPLYRPLIETVLAHGLPIIGSDLSGAAINRIVTENMHVLGARRVQQLTLDIPLSARSAGIMRTDIVSAHCGYAPHARLDGMIAAQRARDAMFADALIAQVDDEDNGAVLIAGSGHVRNDFAVPAYLRRRAPDKNTASVAFTEVAAGKPVPAGYLPTAAHDGALYDYLWFTPGSQPRDPCTAFRQRLRKLREPES